MPTRPRRRVSRLTFLCLIGATACVVVMMISCWRSVDLGVPLSRSHKTPPPGRSLLVRMAAIGISRGSLFAGVGVGSSNWGPVYFEIAPARSLPYTRLGFGVLRVRSYAIVAFPLYLPAAAFGTLAYHLHRRHRARMAGEEPVGCRICGYDLRASKDRCPECGTAIS